MLGGVPDLHPLLIRTNVRPIVIAPLGAGTNRGSIGPTRVYRLKKRARIIGEIVVLEPAPKDQNVVKHTGLER